MQKEELKMADRMRANINQGNEQNAKSQKNNDGQAKKKILDLIPYLFPFLMLAVLALILLILKIFQIV